MSEPVEIKKILKDKIDLLKSGEYKPENSASPKENLRQKNIEAKDPEKTKLLKEESQNRKENPKDKKSKKKGFTIISNQTIDRLNYKELGLYIYMRRRGKVFFQEMSKTEKSLRLARRTHFRLLRRLEKLQLIKPIGETTKKGIIRFRVF